MTNVVDLESGGESRGRVDRRIDGKYTVTIVIDQMNANELAIARKILGVLFLEALKIDVSERI